MLLMLTPDSISKHCISRSFVYIRVFRSVNTSSGLEYDTTLMCRLQKILDNCVNESSTSLQNRKISSASIPVVYV